MSVKIEILDYKFGAGDDLVDFNLGTPTGGWSISQSNNQTANWSNTGVPSGAVRHYEDITPSLIGGEEYNLKIVISNYSGTGNIGVSSGDFSGTQNGVGLNFRSAGNITITGTFTWDGAATGGLRVFGNGTNSGTIKVELIDASVIDWDKSVVGELDVTDHSDFPLAMTFQISDIKDLTSTSGDYSKTFKIPATKNNNKLLKHPYTPNIDTDVNLTENKKCRILINNLFSIKGLIKVTGVGGYGETPSYYDCVFFGSNLGWADDLSNKYMNELDWGVNGEDLEYNKTKIINTWQDENCDSSTSPIVYPITSYGDYNPDGEPKTIQLLDTAYDFNQTGSTNKKGYYGFFDDGSDYGTPKPSADWRPAVFVKDTLEKIFSEVGYSINSTFIETDMFKKLVWLLPNFKYNNSEERYDEYSYGNRFTGEGLIDSFTASTTGTNSYTFTEFFPDLNDAGVDFVLNSTTQNTGWDASTGIFTAQEYGYYNISTNNFGLYFDNVNAPANFANTIEYVRFSIQVKTVGQQSTASSFVNISSVQSDQFLVQFGNSSSQTGSIPLTQVIEKIFLNKGDKIRLKVLVKMKTNLSASTTLDFHLFGSSTPTSPTQSDNANGEYIISFNSESVEYGQTYDLDKVINKDYKQIDFVKGIAHAFNLKMTTDETTKTVNIEPFDTFYKDYAEAIDWTYKLDRSKQIEDKWIKSDLKRDVVFKYKTDSKDKKVERRGEEWFDGIKDEYPYQETLPKTFEKGESKYENPFFAGTYNAKDLDTTNDAFPDTAFSACLWEEITDPTYLYRPDKGYEFLPRLLYWNKYSPSSGSSYEKHAKVQTWASIIEIIHAGASSNLTFLSDIYPQATSINRDDSSSPILSYGNVNVRDYDDATGAYTSYASGNGLFATYYKNMFEMFKAKPRLRTLYIDLKTTDIINLDFRKLVYIDGVYWRINKVVDYQPNKNQPTKVELVEWLQLGAFASTAPSFGGNENTGGLGNTGPAETDNGNIGL